MKTINTFTRHSHNIILALSLPAFILIIIASVAGLLVPGTYYLETINWTSQSMGQDVIDLFLISPVLIIAAFFAARKNRVALTVWGGTNLYLIYTFLIYSFDIHFNRLFIIYCMILGLSFYSFLYFLILTFKESLKDFTYNKAVVRGMAFYFIGISCLFYFLWLSKIIPAIISHSIPQDLIDTGLTTNPVHVIDLAIFLPGFFITGILLLKNRPLGFFLAPVMLVFFILMDITIAGLTIGMRKAGIETAYSVTIVMGFLALFSLDMLVMYFKRIKTSES